MTRPAADLPDRVPGSRFHPDRAAAQAVRRLGQPFTEEDGLRTPSLKLKRKAIENAYANEVEVLYQA